MSILAAREVFGVKTMKAAITAHLNFSSLGKFTGARSAWTPQTIEKTQRAFLRLLSGHLLNVYLMAQNLSHSSVGVNRYLYMDSVARKAAQGGRQGHFSRRKGFRCKT